MTFTASPRLRQPLRRRFVELSQSEFHSAALSIGSLSPSHQAESRWANKALSGLREALDDLQLQPLTGLRRTDAAAPDSSDLGQHTVCCVVTEKFSELQPLQRQRTSGTPCRPWLPGLKPGDIGRRLRCSLRRGPLKMASLHRCAGSHPNKSACRSFARIAAPDGR